MMIYDYNTKNKSFLQVYKVLKEKGIRNDRFMLSLNNERLISIDPYDPNLTFQDKIEIINECHNNIWYFLREVVRIPEPAVSSIPFQLDVSNCAQIYLTMLNCNSWVTKPRTIRSTMSSLVLGDYLRIFYASCENKVYLCDRSVHDVNHLKCRSDEIIALLPYYLRLGSDEFYEGIISTKGDFDIECGFIYFDDGEFIPNIKNIYDQFKDKLISDLPIQDSNIISCFTSASVIFDISGIGEYLDNSIKWFDWFYDIDPQSLINFINASPNKLVHIYTSYKDLGLGEEWIEKERICLNNDPDVMRKEIFLKRKDEE